MTLDLQKRAGRPRCHPSPHPRKHSLDFHLRPMAVPPANDTHSGMHSNAHSYTASGYQIPRPASTPLSRPPHRPSSTPSVDSLTQAELNASTPAPPPRPPKPSTITAQGERSVVSTGLATLPRSTTKSEKRDDCVHLPRCNTVASSGRTPTGKEETACPKNFTHFYLPTQLMCKCILKALKLLLRLSITSH